MGQGYDENLRDEMRDDRWYENIEKKDMKRDERWDEKRYEI